MGGKQKQAQRTKNNARPSNSGRSAELLGTNLPHFPAFSGLRETCFANTAFSLSPADEFDQTVDANFQVVFKRMSKKDATTKLKALQEFTDLVKSTDPEVMKGLLPFWPRLYSTLVTDADHKVREASHVAHHQVVLKAKRNLAPYLKQLVGPWFTSQYDTYAPASTSAALAFQDAFPINKVQEAIVFCQEEILNYIHDNITAQVSSNPKTASPEECKAKYERVIISSLLGYALYLEKVPKDAIQMAEQLNTKIVTNDRFWKLAKSDVVQIRSAWFGVITALCQKATFLLEREPAKVAKAVCGNLDESEPAVLSNLWEATLLVITTLNEWWKYINIDLMLLPKLWKVLREAGQGNATVIYPNLLPLLSHLPPTIDIDNFYRSFFDNLRTGLNYKTAAASQSESRAIAMALTECLQFTVLKQNKNETFCVYLVTSQLVPALKSSLENEQSFYKTLFSQVTSLVQYWHKNRNNPDLLSYQRYLRVFWSEVGKLLRECAQDNETISRQTELLVSLKNQVKQKKQARVKFGDASDKVAGGKRNQLADLDAEYFDCVNSLVYETCLFYIRIVNERIDDEATVSIPDWILTLHQEFGSEQFLRHLTKNLCNGSNRLLDLYKDLYRDWIKKLKTKAIINLVFLLYKHLDDDEKQVILADFKEDIGSDCLGWCVATAMSHPYNADVIVRDWLKTKVVEEFFVKLATQETEDKNSPEQSCLLKQSFLENDEGELFISAETLSRIVGGFCKCLLLPNDYRYTINTFATLAVRISAVIYTEKLGLTFTDELLKTLFFVSCNSALVPDFLTKDTYWEIKTAWQDALLAISPDISYKEVESIIHSFEAYVLKQLKANEMTDATAIDLFVNFALALRPCHRLFLHNLLDTFFAADDREYLTKIALSAERLRGTLVDPNERVSESAQGACNESKLLLYFRIRNIVVAAANARLEVADRHSRYASDDVDTELYIDVYPEPEKFIADLVYDAAICESFLTNYKSMRHHSDLSEYRRRLVEQIAALVTYLDEEASIKTGAYLQSKVETDAWLWCRAARVFHVEILQIAPKKVFGNMTSGRPLSDRSALHTVQVFAADLSFDDVAGLQRNDIAKLATLRCLLGHCEDIDVQIAGAFEDIKAFQARSADCGFQNIHHADTVQYIVESLRFWTCLVGSDKWERFVTNHWDQIIFSLSLVSNNLYKTKTHQPQILITGVTNLFTALSDYIKKLKVNEPSHQHIEEWTEIIMPDLTNQMLNDWWYVAGSYLKKGPENVVWMEELPYLHDLGRVISSVDVEFLFKSTLCKVKWSKLLFVSCDLLTNSSSCLQLWGYHALQMMSKGLTEVDSVSVGTNRPHEKGMVFEQFKWLLMKTHEIVKTMLMDIKLGEDNCRVEPETDAYCYTFAYFLIWDVLLQLCEKSSTELRFQYSDWLRKEDLLSSLLSTIFRLMPLEVLLSYDAKTKPHLDWFVEPPSFLLDDIISSLQIERMACWVYARSLAVLPASVRQWWSNVETRTALIVERVSSAYVSPQLCQQELNEVAQNASSFKNMVVKIHASVREVVAVYTVDESQMELVITLPANYPLGGPDVQCNRQICGTSHKQWLMQLRMCVLHQNGRIWDALLLWNNNLSKKFDGVEECYICFAVLHPWTYQLPKLSCHTCRKKFHAACLYKWFSTSNKSTCPICRNLF